MKFHKYHGLGNDYIVIDPEDCNSDLSKEAVKLICDRNYGAGSDGILYGPQDADGIFGLRIFNPDGSEAEKSGNGLRIFSRYLWEKGLVKDEEFLISTAGGIVKASVHQNGSLVRVEMGKVTFDASAIPVSGESGECLNKTIQAGDSTFTYSAASVGNPHCVILLDEISPEIARKYGPLIETSPKFPNRTNVQFMKIVDEHTIQIEIWERGAGYTLASGSSSTAAAAVAFRLQHCRNSIDVRMPGGELAISFTDDFQATMTGPVRAVYQGEFKKELFEGI